MRVAALAALAAAGLAGCGGAGGKGTATSSVTPAGHTFIDLVAELPTNLDETGTPDAASTAAAAELVERARASQGRGTRAAGSTASRRRRRALPRHLVAARPQRRLHLQTAARGARGVGRSVHGRRCQVEPRAGDRPLAGRAVPLRTRPHRHRKPGHRPRPPSRAHQRHGAEPVHAVGARLLRRGDLRQRALPLARERDRSVGAAMGQHALGELWRLLGRMVLATPRDRARREPRLLAPPVLRARADPPGRERGDARRRGPLRAPPRTPAASRGATSPPP